MKSGSRVAIEGVGLVAPGATGVEQFEQLLMEGRSGIAMVDRFDTSGQNAHKAGLIRGFQARQFIAPGKIRRMNTLSRQAVAATKMARTDAAIETNRYDPSEIGVALGTAFGPVQTSVDYMREYVEQGSSLAPPQLFAESVANAPGSHIAIEFDHRGFNLTLTQRESSALAATMFACSQIVKGTVKAAMAVGVEELNEITFSVLDKIGALSSNGAKEEASRPFDRDRDGMVVGEGAAAFYLDGSPRDGETSYGYFAGFGIARDRTASISNWGTGASAVVRAMSDALRDAEITIGEVDAIWASANGSLAGDRLEASALRQMFGNSVPPVVATKGYFGEYAGAGALHLVTAAVAMRRQWIPASLGFEESEIGLELPVNIAGRPSPLRNILVNSLSAGGGIVCAILSRQS
ncbi:MAG TPA: beta-ketoacyl synthase N-terminal-like domain-containing protein [Thermoanaerobaculia bacterium]|nr:beta-ketoacyl synthase N-terminal-like domain-containing protein [Thermoanaerobaculia bacterium]